MAKYDLSQKGADDLRQLSKDLSAINKEIEESGKKLQSLVLAVQDDLGNFGESIMELVKSVNDTRKRGSDAVEQLQKKLTQMAANIETLMKMNLGGK